ncbi:hypothetical protein KCG44_09235 [Pacificimonas sp. WHA3]|uniref:Uncharacterized protein n=1 Tax=Pacificimonas pallii TaxID=2827236 RepID=A0ABS6SEZ6_9SPHN|nr:hypothetical protein [Pacificimonas pallii]MBV7256964.1 hypothetical protein [Pacificimonas pallii]
MWINRLDGRALDDTDDAVALTERLHRAEPVLETIEAALGMEFAPASSEPENGYAGWFQVIGRDAEGDANSDLTIALSADALAGVRSRESGGAAIGRHLPVEASLDILLPPVAATAANGDVIILGGDPGMIVTAPDPIGKIAHAAGKTDKTACPHFHCPRQEYSMRSLEAARRGEALRIPEDMSGTLHQPDGRVLEAQLVRVGGARGVRVGKAVDTPASAEAA